MNWLDVVIIIILLISAFGGLKNGLINSLFSLAGFIIGVVLAGHFYMALSSQLGFISNPIAAEIAAFLIIFFAVVVFASILGAIFTKIISAILLGWLNRLAGAVFGVLTGAIFVAALLSVWVKFLGASSFITDSTLAPVLLGRFSLVLALLPQEFGPVRQFFQ